ncbi:MAG: hydrogenase maturation nickel metallochaperone HypA/HybF [Candidatus Zipacnadales bacterium]
MHETGLAEGIIEALRKVQSERETPIKRARVQVGELSGISPDHLAEHFYEAAEGTEFENIELETEVCGLMAKCGACEALFEVTDETEACPECGRSDSLSVQAESTVRLVAVE